MGPATVDLGLGGGFFASSTRLGVRPNGPVQRQLDRSDRSKDRALIPEPRLLGVQRLRQMRWIEVEVQVGIGMCAPSTQQ